MTSDIYYHWPVGRYRSCCRKGPKDGFSFSLPVDDHPRSKECRFVSSCLGDRRLFSRPVVPQHCRRCWTCVEHVAETCVLAKKIEPLSSESHQRPWSSTASTRNQRHRKGGGYFSLRRSHCWRWLVSAVLGIQTICETVLKRGAKRQQTGPEVAAHLCCEYAQGPRAS